MTQAQATAVRQELHTFIDTLPDHRIFALQPLLADLAVFDEQVYIETDLTDEEHALIADSVKRYHEHPETFVTLDSLM
ncbi:MAG: hypothetical protein Ta2B_08020 [Termitinemataceae bacterium]|nr:MAG: hypothetical protein Ta2B_08020 [Termitinemataceae bacterium]